MTSAIPEHYLPIGLVFISLLARDGKLSLPKCLVTYQDDILTKDRPFQDKPGLMWNNFYSPQCEDV